jgi:small subunit ribosomal protein S3
MGQKTNPIGLRLGIIRGWDSNWYGGKKFDEKLVEDDKIRKYINARLAKSGISRIVIERNLKLITVTIHSSRPGLIIGRGGQDVDKLKEELKVIITKGKSEKEIQINIHEVKRPDLEAVLVGASVAKQIEGRIGFRRAVKSAIAATMRSGAEGIKIMVSGRLGGAEMARTEQYKEGRIPLHTLRADIDYATSEAHTSYGRIGIKTWIFKGEVYEKREIVPFGGAGSGYPGQRFNKPAGERGERGDRRRGGDRPRGDRDRRDRNDRPRDDKRGGDRPPRNNDRPRNNNDRPRDDRRGGGDKTRSKNN